MLFMLSGSEKSSTLHKMITPLAVRKVHRIGDHTVHGSADKKSLPQKDRGH
jgi:hypothetical protein